MREFFKRIIKCRIRGIHKYSVSEHVCVRCNYNPHRDRQYQETKPLKKK
ncbi:ribosomal protein L37E [Natronobacillus azotifigens]